MFIILDIDECFENVNICGEGNCQNFIGGYQCQCNPGYIEDAGMKQCIGLFVTIFTIPTAKIAENSSVEEYNFDIFSITSVSYTHLTLPTICSV